MPHHFDHMPMVLFHGVNSTIGFLYKAGSVTGTKGKSIFFPTMNAVPARKSVLFKYDN
jgi:hypothetical protein